MTRRGATRWSLAVILLVGAILRGLYLQEFRQAPDFTSPGVDAGFHDYWARALVSGDFSPPQQSPDPEISRTPYFRPPGYPYFLAAIYALSDGSWLAPRVVQMLLGLLGIILAALLGRRWYGERVSLLFASLMAVCWLFIYFEGEFLEPALLVPLALLLVLLAGRWTEHLDPWRALAAGVVLGLFALVRPNILLFLPVLLAWGWWVGRARKNVLRPAALLLLGAALAIAPATVRNYRVSGERVLISTNGGINLYLGNNERADGLIAGEVPGFGPFMTCFDYPGIAQAVRRQLGKPLTHAEISSYFTGLAREYLVGHPGRTLALLGKKTLLFWGPLEVSHNKVLEAEREHSRVLGLLPGSFWLFAGLALAGLILFFAPRRLGKTLELPWPRPTTQQIQLTVLVLLFVLIYFASYLPFTIAGRYRVPVVPFVLLLAALCLDYGWRCVEARRPAPLLAWCALTGAAITLAAINFSGYVPDRPKWHYDRGMAYEQQPDFPAALKEFAQAVALDPSYVDALAELGLARAATGDQAGALQALQDATRVNPRYPLAHSYLGKWYRNQGNVGAARSELAQAAALEPYLWRGHYELAVAHLDAGDHAAALAACRRALELNPRSQEAAALRDHLMGR